MAQKKPVGRETNGLFVLKNGDTYFRAFGTIIGSKSLTAVFGKGTGVTFSIWSPKNMTGR